MKTELSIIYVYFNTENEILISIASIEEAIDGISYEVIIVDNASRKALFLKHKKNKRIKIFRNEKNFGYGKAMNQGVKKAVGKFVLLSNSDIFFKKNSIKLLLEKLKKDPSIGIVAPQQLNENVDVLQSVNSFPTAFQVLFAFSFFNKLWRNNQFSRKYWLDGLNINKEQIVEVVGGACIMMKKSLFNKIGGFDKFFFMYFEEIDLCKRVNNEGYKNVYYPKSKVIHLVGKSMQDKDWIEKQFEKSRLYFLKKYYGIPPAFFIECFLRLTKTKNLLLFFVFSLSLFLNLYKINSLMMFFGDFGRDYLAARDMILTGRIPLVGIPSSVTWLHQGPLSIYLIALAFLLGHFNPSAPAFFYGILNASASILVYKLGKTFFNHKVGFFSSAFFATSPLVVVFARMPYHTSPIPFFSCLFFIVFYKILQGRKNLIMFCFFLLGLLLQLELSNAVVLFLITSMFLILKIRYSAKDIFKAIGGFLIGVLPFILYDVTNKFIYTFGFPLWIMNRVRLFLGLTISGNSTTAHVPDAINSITNHLVRATFPWSKSMAILILLSVFFIILKNKERFLKKNIPFLIIIFWFFLPIFSYIIHAAPGPAYFPLILPALSLIVGFSFYYLFKIRKEVLVLFFFITTMNMVYLVRNNYFLVTQNTQESFFEGWDYGLGPSLKLQEEAAYFMVRNSEGKNFQIKGGGFLNKFSTSVDNYKYLVWWLGGNVTRDGKIEYIVYEDKKEIKNGKISFTNGPVFIVKHEEN